MKESRWFSLYEQGKSAYRHRDFVGAENALRAALKVRSGDISHDASYALTATALADTMLDENWMGWRDIESLHKQSLQIRKNALGEEHPQTVASMANLAHVYRSQRRFAEAEALFNDAFRIEKSTHRVEDPFLAWAMVDLAIGYVEQSRYTEAESLYRTALAIQRKTLGEDNLATRDTIYCLELLYEVQHSQTSSEPLLKEVLRIDRRVQPDKWMTAFTMTRLAGLYLEQNRNQEAIPLLTEGISLFEQSNNKENDFSGVIGAHEDRLGLACHRLGRGTDAETHYKKALRLRQQEYGSDSAVAVSTMIDFAASYNSRMLYSDAEPLLKRAIRISKLSLSKNLTERVTVNGAPGISEKPQEQSMEFQNMRLATQMLAELYRAQGRRAEVQTTLDRNETLMGSVGLK